MANCFFRIGRTGRVGNTGRATSFIDVHEDHNIAGPLVKVLVDAGQMVPEWLGSGRRGLLMWGVLLYHLSNLFKIIYD